MLKKCLFKHFVQLQTHRLNCIQRHESSVENVSSRFNFRRKKESDQVFSEMATDWWWSPRNPLFTYNEIRVPFILRGLVNAGATDPKQTKTSFLHLEGVKILDVGCGGGILSEGLARLGATVVGIDPNKQLIDVAIKHKKTSCYRLSNLTYENVKIHEHADEHREFYDAVVSSEVIEHVDDKETFLKSCLSALKPSGSIFLTTPNRTLFAKWFLITCFETLRILAPGTHDYNMFITEKELQNLLKKLGCQIYAIQGIKYNPVTGVYSISYYRDFLYAVHAVKQCNRGSSLSSASTSSKESVDN